MTAAEGEKAMSQFVVYSIPGSPYGRALLATLEEKHASYRFSPVAPGTSKQEPHISRHPFGRVPVLEHDGFMLYETQAMLRYLDRVLPTPPLTPQEAKAAARMDQAMNINDWYLFQGVNTVIGWHRVVGPRAIGLTPDESACAAAMPKAHAVCNELARLLGPQPYFAGDAVTLADLLLMPQLDILAQAPEWASLSAGNRNLVDWLDRMNARDSLKATTWERVADMAKAA
jgi:glutathione S-transferase